MPRSGTRLFGCLPGAAPGINLRLTDLGASDYDSLRTVIAMTYLVCASGRNGSSVPQHGSATDNAATTSADDLGVHPGTSEATRMVGGVLLLVPATIILVLVMV